YTASGLLASAGIVALLAPERPGGAAFRWSLILLVVAAVIDCTDGALARAVRIKETLPGFDGRRLDDLVDWLNYTCLPLFVLWKAAVLPGAASAWLLAPFFASAYGFCQTAIKTPDGFFLGFPSLWNVVAIYLYALQPVPPAVTLASLLGL